MLFSFYSLERDLLNFTSSCIHIHWSYWRFFGYINELIYIWDHKYKHVLTCWNNAWYLYTMAWKVYYDEKIQLYAWDKHFRKFLPKNMCPEGWFFRVWLSKRGPDALLAKNMLITILLPHKYTYINIDLQHLFVELLGQFQVQHYPIVAGYSFLKHKSSMVIKITIYFNNLLQGLSQDLETGCPKLAIVNCKVLGQPNF